ncbi:MAG: hypothetical protein EXR72_22235 [Myxococcales bacterium]|nr:hypothetical protein [Myxococcales bacterium]
MKSHERALLDAPENPFADPVVRLEQRLAPPPHVENFHAATRHELRRAIDAVGGSGRAAMVLVRGDAGQGKTHELARLRAAARHEHAFHFLEIPPLKDPGAPFQHVLRYAAQGLIVQKLLARFLWEVLRGVAGTVQDAAIEEGDVATAARVEAALLGGDRYVDAFRVLVRDDPGLPELLARRGRGLPPLEGLDPDFARVLCGIPDPEVERAVGDWLRGEELSDESLRLLGVTRSLDAESRCFEVLGSLVRVSPRPLVLCFDQVESTSGLLGPDGVVKLFYALMEIYQHLPVCIVLMCQTQVWSELTPLVPQAALERIRELPRLALPTPEEAERLVAARLQAVFAAAETVPPHPCWPFSQAWLSRLVIDVRPSVRQLFLRCGDALEVMRQRGRIAELGAEAKVSEERPPRPPTAEVALADEHRRKLGEVEMRDELRVPALRQERVRSAVKQILGGASDAGRAFGGARIAALELPAKPRKGPPPPLVVTAERPDGKTRIALDVHSGDANGAWRVIDRLLGRVERGEADLGVLLREAAAPLGEHATATQERVQQLEARGGGIEWIERDAAHRLVASELLLDAASASEVWAGDRPVTRSEALAYLLEHEDLGLLQRLVSRVALPAPAPGPAPTALADQDLPARVLTLLGATSAVMPWARVSAALEADESSLVEAVDELARTGRVHVAIDRGGARIVMLARTPTG